MTATAHGVYPAEGRLIGGRYRLEQLIGEGGSGTVWRARHLTLDQPVAIKFLHRYDDPEQKERFLREAKVAAAIHHRNVVRINDFGVDHDFPFMVMEFLEGYSLADRMNMGVISLSEGLGIIAQALSGLAAVHDAGMAHRDIKPENIFIVRDSEGDYPKLVDFGLSKNVGIKNAHLKSVMRTQENAIAGTPHYMSPEQARGIRDIDLRTDVFSMGVVCFEILTGKTPFDSEHVGELLIMIATKDAPRLILEKPEYGQTLSDVIAKSLRRDRGQRFVNARHMREAVLAGAAETASVIRDIGDEEGEAAARSIMHTISRAYEPGDSQVVDPSEREAILRLVTSSDTMLDREVRLFLNMRRRWVAIGGTLLLGVGAVIAAFAFSGEQQQAEPLQPVAAKTTTAAPPPEAVAPVGDEPADVVDDSAAVAAEEAKVYLALVGLPRGAEVFLDGRRVLLENDRTFLEKSDAEIMIEVRHRGEVWRKAHTPTQPMHYEVNFPRKNRPKRKARVTAKKSSRKKKQLKRNASGTIADPGF